MKSFIVVAFILTSLLCGCSKDSDPGYILGDDPEYRYIILKNGDPVLNLYPKGLIGLAPGESSDPISVIVSDIVFQISYSWSDNTSKYETSIVDLKDTPIGSTKTVIITK